MIDVLPLAAIAVGRHGFVEMRRHQGFNGGCDIVDRHSHFQRIASGRLNDRSIFGKDRFERREVMMRFAFLASPETYNLTIAAF
jgi:hypothetical protein